MSNTILCLNRSYMSGIRYVLLNVSNLTLEQFLQRHLPHIALLYQGVFGVHKGAQQHQHVWELFFYFLEC